MAVTDERVSRRRLLKRAGVGAAVLGAGSMVSASAASAQEGSTVCRDIGGCGAAALFPACDIHGGNCCVCVVDQSGCCVCAENIFCVEANTCVNESDCPAGWTCWSNPNGCGHAICAPVCGTPSHITPPCLTGAAALGATAAGGGGAASHHPEPEAPDGGHGGHQHG